MFGICRSLTSSSSGQSLVKKIGAQLLPSPTASHYVPSLSNNAIARSQTSWNSRIEDHRP